MEKKIEISVEIDGSIFDQAEAIYDGIGIDVPTAVKMFFIQSVRSNGLPFLPKALDDGEIEYSERLLESVKQMQEGRFVVKTIEELIAMEVDDSQ